MTAPLFVLMLAGLLALGWAILSPRANILVRLAAVALGIAAIIASRAVREQRRDRQ